MPDKFKPQRLCRRASRVGDAQQIFDRYARDQRVAHFMIWQPHRGVAQTQWFIESCIDECQAGRRQANILAPC